MLYNDAADKGISFTDYGRVVFHGFTLDAATTGYLTALPWLAVLVRIWLKQFPLRKILTAYYALISLLVALIFIGDMALYPFWGFKLDASVFFYLDSPKNAAASVSIGFILLRIISFKLDASVFFYLDSPKNAAASVSIGFILLRIISILLLSVLTTWGLYKLTPAVLPATQHRISGSIGTLLLGGVLFIIIRGGVTESTSNVGQVYFCNNEFLNHSAVNPAFSLLSSASKTQDYAKQFDFTPAVLPATQHRISGRIGTLLLGGVLFIIIRGGVTESTSNVGQGYFCNNEFLNNSAVNPAFSLLSSASKTQEYSKQFDLF